mgnify:CR=1 FL=1
MVDPEVIQSMQECWGSQLGNPTSNHSFGRKAHRLVEEARIKVANAVGALLKEVFYTSSGSESNNWFVNGMAKVNPDAKFFYGATEHPCISKPIQQLQNIGIFSEVIPVKTSGEVDETFFKKLNNLGKFRFDIFLVNIILTKSLFCFIKSLNCLCLLISFINFLNTSSIPEALSIKNTL